MTLPVYLETMQAVYAGMRELAKRQQVPFVDAYSKVPGTVDNFTDHVHLRAAETKNYQKS